MRNLFRAFSAVPCRATVPQHCLPFGPEIVEHYVLGQPSALRFCNTLYQYPVAPPCGSTLQNYYFRLLSSIIVPQYCPAPPFRSTLRHHCPAVHSRCWPPFSRSPYPVPRQTLLAPSYCSANRQTRQEPPSLATTPRPRPLPSSLTTIL